MDNFNNTNYEYDPSGQGYYSEGYNEGYYQGGGGPHIYPEGGEAYYDAGGGGTGYPPSYNGVDAATSYYPQQQYDYSQGSWDQGQGSHDWNNSQSATNSTKKGNFYFHTEFTPQISGFPVSSLAYDAAYEAMYVASTTQSVSSTRWKSHRASMLVTHSTLDGMLYSSVAGHPEASSSALQTVYGCMFGIPKTVLMPPGRQHIPPHAYKAPFGGSNVEFGREQGQIGITEILPLNGYAASVSPSAVRIHAHGGLQLHDHDIEGMICGTIHPRSDQGAATHISVGGISCGSQYKDHEIYCMDLWQGLRTVSTRNIRDAHDKKVGITTLVTSHDRGSIIAGCSDGNIRLLDGALRELATVKTHSSGVSSMAVSADGMLIATTGYGSAGKVKDTSVLYAFPDPTVYVYDIRYLGRGGISHPFAGVRGSPHHLIFVQDIDGLPSNRLMIGSGQPGGGLQVIVPFQAQDQGTTSFYTPPWEQGESISAMSQSDDEIALGTSLGRVLRYRLKGYQLTKIKSPTLNSGFVPSKSPNKGSSLTSSNKRSRKKQPLEMPPFVPPMPAVSVDPNLLLNGNDHGMRNGADEKIKSLFGTYILHVDPKLSSIGNTVEDAPTTFGSLASTPAFPGKRRTVAPNFLNEATPGEVEYLLTVPTSKLDLDLLASHNVVSKRYRGKLKDPQPNPNKFLYCSKLSSVCYEDGLNGKRRNRGTRSNSVGVSKFWFFSDNLVAYSHISFAAQSGDLSDEVPPRYRLQKRPNFKSSGAFDPSDYNDTGLFPGWDYVPTMPNAFASPVLLLLYFHPEIRSAVLAAQYSDGLWSAKGYEKALSPELGFVFNQIESLSRFGLVHPVKANSDPLRRRIGAWIPSNFLTALSTMPEAEQLQILDGSPAAVDPQRRPEAFYRTYTESMFMLQVSFEL